jgi:hypothetical protein
MRITIYSNIGKEEAIEAIAVKEKGKRANESREEFVQRVLPNLKGKSFDRPSLLKRGE